MIRVAVDTNVLAYAEGVNGDDLRLRADLLLRSLPEGQVNLPAQALAELYNVLVRKARRPPAAARAAVLQWADIYEVVDVTAAVVASALELAERHRFSIWDGIVRRPPSTADAACCCPKTSTTASPGEE